MTGIKKDYRHQDLVWVTSDVDAFLFDRTVRRLYRYRPGEEQKEIIGIRLFDILMGSSVVPESRARAFAKRMQILRIKEKAAGA